MIDAGTPPFDLLAVVLDGQKSAAPREIGRRRHDETPNRRQPLGDERGILQHRDA